MKLHMRKSGSKSLGCVGCTHKRSGGHFHRAVALFMQRTVNDHRGAHRSGSCIVKRADVDSAGKFLAQAQTIGL